MDDKAVLHKALIIMQSHINAQMEVMGQAFSFMKDTFSLVETSNVYLKYLDANKGHSSRGQLIVAITVETQIPPEQLNGILQTRMQQYPNAIDYFLVLYEDETRLTPNLTLPHPDLHSLPFWLVPAVELWGAAVHPVLDKTLQDLAGDNTWDEWGEFYAQGKVLLDFYYKQRK